MVMTQMKIEFLLSVLWQRKIIKGYEDDNQVFSVGNISVGYQITYRLDREETELSVRSHPFSTLTLTENHSLRKP
jgi:hypothetical protein